MNALVEFALEDGLCILTLNRPEKLNALNAGMFAELDHHLGQLSAATTGCLLLRGAGRSFCAGHELDGLSGKSEDAGRRETGIIERLATLPFPVVAAVQGHCLTGGLELALAANIIIAAESARFGDTHGKWDLVPIWGLSQRLPRRIGVARAYEMMFASRTYTGADAAAMGLANFCVADVRLQAEAERLCRDILENSWRASRAMKQLVMATDGLPLAAGIAWEMHHSEGRGPETAERIARAAKR